jgi:hypothetical protein
MRKNIMRDTLVIALVAFLLLILLAGCDAMVSGGLNRTVQEKLSEDSRNGEVDIRARYGGFSDRKTLVLDIQSASGSRLDAFRVVLQTAEVLQDQAFEEVRFAFRGDHRYSIPGAYFQELGREYSYQNPAYTMRTFPTYVRRPDGSGAFSLPRSSGIWAITEQMERFNQFHDGWWWNDMLAQP